MKLTEQRPIAQRFLQQHIARHCREETFQAITKLDLGKKGIKNAHHEKKVPTKPKTAASQMHVTITTTA